MPKDTLGSHLSNTLPRPQSGIIKAKPTFKINTQTFSLTSKAEILDNKQERIDLIQKLRKICNTRSFKLLEDVVKAEKKEKTEENNNDIKTEVKKIWQTTDIQKKQLSDDFFFSFQENYRQNIRNNSVTEIKSSPVIVPGPNCKKYSDNHLFPIPETKIYESGPFKIDPNQLKFYKKACEIKNFNLNLETPQKNTGFKGKLIFKSKSLKKTIKRFE